MRITQQRKKSRGYRKCLENLEVRKLKINSRAVLLDMKRQITDLCQQLKAQREEEKESHRITKKIYKPCLIHRDKYWKAAWVIYCKQ